MDKLDFIENFLPNSPLFFLFYLGGFLLFGIVLVFMISRFVKEEEKVKEDKKLSIDELLKIAENPSSNSKDLLLALMSFDEYFKIGDDRNKSFKFFKKVLMHKNRNKALFDFFHGKILPNNLEFKDKLNQIEKEALNK